MEPEHRARLGVQDDAFRGAPIAGQANTVPDDDYHAVVDRFDFIDTKSGLKLKTELSVAVGPYSGAELATWHDLEAPEKFKYLKGHLAAMDVEVPDSLSMLDSVLKAALDRPVHVTVKTSGEYKNVYVNRSLGEPIRSANWGSPGETPTPDEGSAPQPAAQGDGYRAF